MVSPVTSSYEDLIASKIRPAQPVGFRVAAAQLHPVLFDFQRAIVAWGLRQGRAAFFEECGLGKTGQQVVWAAEVVAHTKRPVIIFAPLTVGQQTVADAEHLLGITVRQILDQTEIEEPGIYITNYDRFHRFDRAAVAGVVLDESSVLKSFDGKTKQALTEAFQDTPFRLCCTATPAPNDITEIANHAEFLGIKTRTEMLATYFVHDADGWRLKKHATRDFYRWLASWAVYVRRPSDLGFSDEGYDLPPLDIRQAIVPCDICPDGMLFSTGIEGGIVGRAEVRHMTLVERVAEVVHLVNAEPDEQWILWCGLNDESTALAQQLGSQAVQVEGSTPAYQKEARLQDFIAGNARILITKVRVAGFGMNFQNCARMAFVGLGDSFEAYYQALRRCWRFGQTREVRAHIVISDQEDDILRNVLRKEEEAIKMGNQILEHMGELERANLAEAVEVEVPPGILDEVNGPDWTLHHGDCVQVMRDRLEPNSVDLSVYSPPFATLYTYSDNPLDMGNSRNHDEFFEQFGHFCRQMLRVTKPGRITCVHVAQIPALLERDGYIGLHDFRGATIQAFKEAGWVHYREVCIDKCPQALRHGSRVLTDRGWHNIEDLNVGDQVIGSNGKPTAVLGVWPQGKRPAYRVTFHDGSFLDCDAQHKWAVRDLGARQRGQGFQVLTTEQIVNAGIRYPNGKRKFEVPLVEPIQFRTSKTPLRIHPYTLGALLGDGCISERATVGIMSQHEVVARCEVPAGHNWRLRPGSEKGGGTVATYAVICGGWHRNDVLEALRGYGLQGARAWEKSVPDVYLYASVDDRKELLRGLLDTDGTIKKNGGIWFGSTSEKLADDVAFLVESLGGIAHRGVDNSRAYTSRGETKHGRTLHTVCVSLNGDWCPFTLPEKVARWSPNRRQPRRMIESIEPVGDDLCTCITVAAADGLFVAENFIVTHNSQAIRTHSKALLFTQMKKDRSWSGPALADYILTFRKPGNNAVPIKDGLTNEEWIEWARPIWYGIKESDTLNAAEGRGENDERHICPLQLGVIERCVKLWSNPGETVFSPFSGIGSEGYGSLMAGRRFIGAELKPEYFRTACRNLRRASEASGQGGLFGASA